MSFTLDYSVTVFLSYSFNLDFLAFNPLGIFNNLIIFSSNANVNISGFSSYTEAKISSKFFYFTLNYTHRQIIILHSILWS